VEPDHPDLGIPGLTGARVLGRGGFGTVYAVDEPEFGRTVAVKILRERLDGDALQRAFARECQAMGALSGHPHIVTVHRGGTTRHGQPYIVMDLMSGGSLADRGALPWSEVLEIGVLLGGALETAHRHGILHLDLKPANVLMSRYGEPKLGDFGIARLPGIAETTGGVRVSPAYAAPERLADGTSTVRTDLYGFGATLFTLLTGTSAFGRDTPEELLVLLARIVRDPVPDLRPRGVPDAVCRAVERAMAKSPGERFASAAGVVEALQDAQRATGRPVTRAVVEGAATTGEEAAARTNLALDPVPPRYVPLPRDAADAPARDRPQSTPPPTARFPPPDARHPPWPSAPSGPPGWSPPAPPPPRRGRRLLIGVGATALVAALAVGTVVVLDRTGAGSGTPPTTPTTLEPPTATPVAVAAGVTDGSTPGALATLGAYVASINDERYAETFRLFAADSRTAQNGLTAWLDQQRPREISAATITSVRARGSGALDVVMTFTSRQAPQDGPQGDQACTEWEQAYELTGPDLLIRSSETLRSRACP
jgi:serine/threonine-protein kinase PknK